MELYIVLDSILELLDLLPILLREYKPIDPLPLGSQHFLLDSSYFQHFSIQTNFTCHAYTLFQWFV